MLRLKPLPCLLLLLLALVAAHAKPTVVVANTLLLDWTHQIGGYDIDLTCLIPGGTDPHEYQPAPSEVAKLSRADALIVNGLGLETWLDRLAQNSGFHGKLVVASRGIVALSDDPERSRHGATDPHAWQDLRNVPNYIEAIADALAGLDPAHATAFHERATAYVAEVDSLRAWTENAFAHLSADRRTFVTSHDSFAYLARAYHLTIIPIGGLQPEQEPSAKHLAHIIDVIRQQHVSAVFFEATSNPQTTQLIAREAGVKVVTELTSDSVGPAGSPTASFLGLYRHNVETIVAALH